ncbi:sulfurtransferase TusA family protein [Allohahella marinimesophila]|uniref:UPF0033 domain-containing protein n=1 Tax=Allohahella marinimesophila TaxID=1054972 RepID=A0ABP7NP32_9GAMM
MNQSSQKSVRQSSAISPEKIRKLDLRGLRCPMPLLKTKLALKTLAADEMLEVTADDAGTRKDFPAFLRLSSFDLIAEQVEGDCFIYHIIHDTGAIAPITGEPSLRND